jgi:hypothetical protein
MRERAHPAVSQDPTIHDIPAMDATLGPHQPAVLLDVIVHKKPVASTTGGLCVEIVGKRQRVRVRCVNHAEASFLLGGTALTLS